MKSQSLIEPGELASLLARGSVVPIDTRGPVDYARSHLPGAVQVTEIFSHFAFSSPEGLEDLQSVFCDRFSAAGLSGEELAVVYEDAMDNGFGRSCRGYFLLKYLGYPRVAVLHGGKRAWDAAGLPTTTDVPSPTRAAFPFRADPSILATADDVLGSLSDPAIMKLDVRDYEEWMGQVASPQDVVPCPRRGRLPGAVWIEWRRLLTRTGGITRVRSPEEILAICRKVGVNADSNVIIYCLGGVRASNTFLALQGAGIRNARVYLGSWYEWSRDPALPIDDGEPDPKRMVVDP